MAAPTHRFCVFFIACALWACGGAPPADPGEAYARIQIEEARIEHADAYDPADCDGMGERCPTIRDAAERLCAIAGEIDERDALARCERARRRAIACDALAAECAGASP